MNSKLFVVAINIFLWIYSIHRSRYEIYGIVCESIGNISTCIGDSDRTVKEHIAVEVIVYSIAIEHNESVIDIILEAALGSVGNISCGIIGKRFFRKNNVTQILNGSLGYTIETIISITLFGRICKYFLRNNSRQIIVSVLKSGDYHAARSSFNRRRHSLLAVVNSSGHASIGLCNTNNTVVYVVGIACHSVSPVGDTDKVVVCVISIGYGSVVGIDQLGKVANRIILVTDNLAVGVGIARYTVESIVGSCDRAVAVGYSQNATCVGAVTMYLMFIGIL